MPPLYRMPVFYLGLVVVALIFGVSTLIRGHDVDPPTAGAHRAAVVADRSSATASTSTPTDPIPGEAPAAGSDDGILETDVGLRRKVLVRALGLQPLDDPGRGGRVASGRTLDYFSIHYVFDEAMPDGPDGPRFVRIGPKDGPPMGWVPADSVLEWNTRLMALPTSRRGRPPLLIYRERSCLLDALAGRDCPEHDGPCPIEGQEPPNPSDITVADPTLGLPILQSEAVPQPDGTDRTIFQVAALVRDRAPPPPPPDEPPDHLKRLLEHVYIAFVIDTTASMQAYIDAARTLASDLAAEAARNDVRLHLALVAYRDDHPAFGYSSRIVSPFTDTSGFRRALDRIEAARRGDGTVDERVFEGLATALPPLTDEPIGRLDHLRWPTDRAGELATKLVVLIGDAPDHARDLVRAQALARIARESRITIAAVSIQRDDLRGDEPERYQAQWDTLAEGSFRPLDRSTGFDTPIEPVRPTLADASSLAPTLQAIIADRVQHARELAALAVAEAEGRLDEYVDSRGLTLDQVAPVLVDLHRGASRPEARPDPRLDGRKAPSVRQGWIAERVDGSPLVSVQMLMSREELDRLIDELSQFQQAVQGGATDLSDLLRIGTAAASGETAFLAADRGDRTFADHLRRRQGLPPAGSDSLLHRSQTDLLQADDLYRAAINDRLARSLSRLIRRRNAIDWSDPKRTTSGMALVPYETIDF